MLRLLDTSVAILLRDLDAGIKRRVAALEQLPVLSILTVVELEGGVAQTRMARDRRRRSVDQLLDTLEVLPFGRFEAAAYGRIVADIGYSRSKVIDRMIGAQAIVVGAVLATLNIRDFRGIPGLRIEDWSA